MNNVDIFVKYKVQEDRLSNIYINNSPSTVIRNLSTTSRARNVTDTVRNLLQQLLCAFCELIFEYTKGARVREVRSTLYVIEGF